VRNVEDYFRKRDLRLAKKASTPMTTNYAPEVDGSAELDTEDAIYCQSLNGILKWIVEMYISMEVSALSPIIAMLREGHMLWCI